MSGANAASGVTALPGEAQARAGLGPDGRVSTFAERVLADFNGGLVKRDNPLNPRGYTVYYRPIEAMRFALANVTPPAVLGDRILADLRFASVQLAKLGAHDAARRMDELEERIRARGDA